MFRLTLTLLLITAPLTASDDEAFVAWAKKRAVPLGESSRALRSLDRDIRSAQLIGVGESVHETEPFGSFRLELLQDHVRRHRVTALILEAGLPDVMAVDDYVHGRASEVDYGSAISGDLGTLMHIRRTMDWLRQWNAGAGRNHPVSVFGSDLPGRQGSFAPALDRLEQLTAGNVLVREAIDAVRSPALQTSSTWWRGASDKYAALTPDAKTELTVKVQKLVEIVDGVRTGDADRDAWIRRVALVVQQHETFLRLGAFSPTMPRDKAMADNITWLLGRLPRGERAVYWAHNAHVQRVPVKGPTLPPGSFPPAGSRLGESLGDRYFAIGTAYGGPSRDRAAAPPEPHSVDEVLGRALDKPFLLILRGGKRPAAVEAWLAEERAMRFQVGHSILSAGKAFDAIVYFDRTSAAPRAPAK